MSGKLTPEEMTRIDDLERDRSIAREIKRSVRELPEDRQAGGERQHAYDAGRDLARPMTGLFTRPPNPRGEVAMNRSNPAPASPTLSVNVPVGSNPLALSPEEKGKHLRSRRLPGGRERPRVRALHRVE